MVDDDRTLIDQVPRTHRPEVQHQRKEARTPTITVVSGPDPGRWISIDGSNRAIFVGRDEACEFTLDDASVSRRHARIYVETRGEGSFVSVLQDLDSTNGTLVNDEPVTRTDLESGDRITLGDIELRFEILDPVDLAFRDGIARRVEEGHRDALTGLLNRAALEAHLPDLVARADADGRALSAVMMDIDHFKRINDSRGHSAGDEVLRQVGRLVAELVRRDDLAIRYGGEEFLIILAGARRLHARLLAERLREALQGSKIAGLESLYVTASMGIAERGPGESLDGWIDRADKALYRAKRRGRNRSEAAPPPRDV